MYVYESICINMQYFALVKLFEFLNLIGKCFLIEI